MTQDRKTHTFSKETALQWQSTMGQSFYERRKLGRVELVVGEGMRGARRVETTTMSGRGGRVERDEVRGQ